MKDGIRRLVNGFDESPGASEFPCRSDKHSAQRRKDAEGRASEHLEVGENESAGLILDSAYTIHSSLGPGLLASVYERALEAELLNAGCRVDRQVPFALNWDGKDLGEAFRADLVVNGRVLVEVKSQEILVPVCAKCVSTYLKISGLRLGLLLNFGSPLLKDGITRVVHGLPD
ncbi:GxxExxY protein [bacterium]|nr:GxxExxY protein [bacterium]